MKKILIVDDEDEILELIQTFLEEKYTVLKASNGETALQIVRKEKPDLILSDVMMPKMSGYDFFKNLQNIQLEVGEIPLIVMSGRPSMKSLFDEWAIVSFLGKPFNGDQLLAEIDKALFQKDALDKVNSAISPSEPAPVIPRETGPKKRFALIASEDENVRKMLKKTLEIQGFTVKIGEDENDLIAKAWEFKPRFILVQFWHDNNVFDAAFVCTDLAEFEDTYKIPLGVLCTPDLVAEAGKTVEKEKIIMFDNPQELPKKIAIYY